MTSFQIAIKPQRRAAARFVAHVRDVLQRRIVDSGRPQAQVAHAIDVHRSVLNRELRGRRDISLSRIAEIAWALGDEVRFDLVRMEPKGNRSAALPGVDHVELANLPFQQTSADSISLDRFKAGLVSVSETVA